MQRKRERVSECVEMDELVDISEDEVNNWLWILIGI